MALAALLLLADAVNMLAKAAGKSGIAARETYLLLDGRLISAVDNAELRLGAVKKHPANPLFGEDLPWETEMSHMYASVIFDREEKIYKCWYYSHIQDWGKDIEPGPLAAREQNGRANCATLYATSKDGLVWDKPKLNVFLHKGGPTNIVNWRDHGTGVFKDLRDRNPERRYKMLGTRTSPGGRVHMAFSPDGIRWTRMMDTKVTTSADTHNNAFWDPQKEEYVMITRAITHGVTGYDIDSWEKIPWVPRDKEGQTTGFVIGQRVVARSASKDFVTWSTPEIVFEYGHDKRQVYAMPSFYTHGVYIGLPVIYDSAGVFRSDLIENFSRQEPAPDLEAVMKRAGKTGRMWPGLSWSPDTKYWKWVGLRGKPLIPLSKNPGFEWGSIFAADAPVILDDEIRVYYSAQPGKHGWNPGHLCLATLRVDGWAGYEPQDDSRAALVETRPIVCSGEALSLAADAKEGSIAVTLLDAEGSILAESNAVKGGAPYTPVTWKKNFDLSEHEGHLVQLRFTIQDAKLYAFKFHNEP